MKGKKKPQTFLSAIVLHAHCRKVNWNKINHSECDFDYENGSDMEIKEILLSFSRGFVNLLVIFIGSLEKCRFQMSLQLETTDATQFISLLIS